MDKKAIMMREIKSIFSKEEREQIKADTSDLAVLSNTIMRICRGACLFVIVITPILEIFTFNLNTLNGFVTSLLYTLFMLFILAPLLYLLLAQIFLKEK